jgi:hypothetical protein
MCNRCGLVCLVGEIAFRHIALRREQRMNLFNRNFWLIVVGWLLSALSLVYGFLISAWIVCLAFRQWMIHGMPDNYNSELGRQIALIPRLEEYLRDSSRQGIRGTFYSSPR